MQISNIGSIKAFEQIKSPEGIRNINTPEPKGNNFVDSIKKGLDSVQNLQDEANEKVKQTMINKDMDPSEAAISMVKAEISMQLTLQIRNKLIDAYQEITRMSI